MDRLTNPASASCSNTGKPSTVLARLVSYTGRSISRDLSSRPQPQPGNYNALIHTSLKGSLFFFPLFSWLKNSLAGTIGRKTLQLGKHLKKIESKSLSHKRFFRFLQHCSFREGRWEGTAEMIERLFNSPTSIKKPYYRATLPEHCLHNASDFWMEGIRCSRAHTTTLSMAYWISWPRILSFIPVLFCPACHLSQGLQWMSAASAFCLSWKYIILRPSTGPEALEQKKDNKHRLRNPDANWNFNAGYATTPECSLEGKSITAQTIKSYI